MMKQRQLFQQAGVRFINSWPSTVEQGCGELSTPPILGSVGIGVPFSLGDEFKREGGVRFNDLIDGVVPLHLQVCL